MTYSNLSKIKPKLRTTGNVTGNFGAPKRTKEAYNSQLGMSSKESIKCTTQDEYLNRLYYAFDNTSDPKLRRFIYSEIRKILIQRGAW
jgi:hypothetical protein